MEETIVTQAGWHSTTVQTTDRTTGLRPKWHVRWRTQVMKCHDQIWGRWDGENLPYSGTSQWGKPHEAVAQCGVCGRVQAAQFTVERV